MKLVIGILVVLVVGAIYGCAVLADYIADGLDVEEE